jgi:hypothetical protein
MKRNVRLWERFRSLRVRFIGRAGHLCMGRAAAYIGLAGPRGGPLRKISALGFG